MTDEFKKILSDTIIAQVNKIITEDHTTHRNISEGHRQINEDIDKAIFSKMDTLI
ncbi:MAG: hypothetical protein WC888_04565 [Candidatus Izemoplasmatales bacterium]|jgi:hypothetical protein